MLTYEYVTSASRLPAIAEEVAGAPVIALDLETTGFDPRRAKIRLLSINTGKGVYVIDAFKCGTLHPVLQALNDSQGIKVGQNLKFDQKFLLYHFNVELWPLFDTYRASAIMWNGRQMGHDLWDLYDRELNIRPTVQDLGGSDWSAWELTQDQLDYAAEDVIHLPKLREVMKPKLTKLGLNTIALIEFGGLLPEGAVELNGFYLNPDAWRKLANENFIRKEVLSAYLMQHLPSPSDQMALPGMTSAWNLDSTPQMLASLRKLGMKIDNTREMTLATQAAKYPVIEKVLEYRGAETQVSSFGHDFLKWVDGLSGRIHSGYWGFLNSGRFACQKPNLAQIPRAKAFRECFQAPPGYRLVICDYANIEMRIAAEVSNDAALIVIFNSTGLAGDAHTQTAALLTTKKLEEIIKEERQMAKPVNFGFLYGMQAEKFVLYALANYGVNLTKRQAESFRTKYFERYDGLRRWHERALRDGKRSRIAASIPGRLRWLDDEKAHNEFLNHPVQATGADGLKAGLREVYLGFKKRYGVAPVRTILNPDPPVKMVHHVHDEQILEIKDDPAIDAEAKEILAHGMKVGMQRFLRKVPVEAESGSGNSWAAK